MHIRKVIRYAREGKRVGSLSVTISQLFEPSLRAESQTNITFVILTPAGTCTEGNPHHWHKPP